MRTNGSCDIGAVVTSVTSPGTMPELENSRAHGADQIQDAEQVPDHEHAASREAGAAGSARTSPMVR